MGNGPYYGGMGTFVVKTKLELAKEATDRALQNLKDASDQLGKAQARYREAQKAESPCLCTPVTTHCTNCGGKK
jgi:hypothetical protein